MIQSTFDAGNMQCLCHLQRGRVCWTTAHPPGARCLDTLHILTQEQVGFGKFTLRSQITARDSLTGMPDVELLHRVNDLAVTTGQVLCSGRICLQKLGGNDYVETIRRLTLYNMCGESIVLICVCSSMAHDAALRRICKSTTSIR